MTQIELVKKIAELVQERDNFVNNANKMLGRFNGRIEVYQEMLAETARTNDEPERDPLKDEHKDAVG